ncbi:DUF2157 domain-containing protein [Corallincola platygyrae]|uniref:DUF2157 domain-containing protein n=1 Tax=Corallincola platygyrae TaxID=1193278 RepID=A0ABW4XIV9_9GAMM
MKLTKQVLQQAADKGVIDNSQVDPLWSFLSAQADLTPSFKMTHLFYYLGGLLAIGSMTLFMTLGWEAFGGWGIFFISLVYMAAGLAMLHGLSKRQYLLPAGICGTFVVAVTPLALYGLQQAIGFWPDDTVYRDYHRLISWHWFYLEMGTLAVGAVILWRYRYPFMVMPIAVTAWYLSMDLAEMLMQRSTDWEFRAFVSIWSGIAMVLIAFWIDCRRDLTQPKDFSFWLYLFGVIAFWGGLTSQHSDSELSKFLYCMTNLGLIFTGVLIFRRVFVVFGALGVSFYIGHLAYDTFKDSWLFPMALTVLGALVAYLGILWQKHELAITNAARRIFPESWLKRLPQHQL